MFEFPRLPTFLLICYSLSHQKWDRLHARLYSKWPHSAGCDCNVIQNSLSIWSEYHVKINIFQSRLKTVGLQKINLRCFCLFVNSVWFIIQAFKILMLNIEAQQPILKVYLMNYFTYNLVFGHKFIFKLKCLIVQFG